MLKLVAALGFLLSSAVVFAQMPVPYGAPITGDAAKKFAAGALAEARKNKWFMAVAIVDTAGDLVYFEKIENTQGASVIIARTIAASLGSFVASRMND